MGASTSVLVDARALQVSGIGRYLREILAAISADPRFARIVLLGHPEELHAYAAESPDPARFDIRSYPYGFYSPRAQLAWLRLRAAGAVKADVAFFPHFDAPAFALPPRSVVTIQDLIHFKVPEMFPARLRLPASLVLRRVVRQASRVLVSSTSTRADLEARIPGSARKVTVIPFGVSSFFSPGEVEAAGMPRAPYLLCVGNRKPHKNLGAAVEALAQLAPERPELSLVVVGRVFPGWEEVLRRAEELGVRERIVDLPSASDTELRDLYRGCEALVFPSLYEGFGLPVLEAMACGAPVIASRRASLPEVVGEAGILFDPERPDEIAEAVRRLASQPELRERLTRMGEERAARFTWERTGIETAELLFRTATGAAPGRLQAALPA
jgi:glycosyltransferase involved in cell wall biosynthesis